MIDSQTWPWWRAVLLVAGAASIIAVLARRGAARRRSDGCARTSLGAHKLRVAAWVVFAMGGLGGLVLGTLGVADGWSLVVRPAFLTAIVLLAASAIWQAWIDSKESH